jgi:hypothetical protein
MEFIGQQAGTDAQRLVTQFDDAIDTRDPRFRPAERLSPPPRRHFNDGRCRTQRCCLRVGVQCRLSIR